MTAPAAGSVVSGNVTVTASATDNVGVAGVRFLLDGAPLGAEDDRSLFHDVEHDSASNGLHTLQARARDAAGNFGTSSSSVTVTVSTPPPRSRRGLIAGWSFDESLGTTVNDVSGNGNTATMQNQPTWTSGRYGGGLRFDGVNDFLTALNSPSMNLSGSAMTVSMWINPLAGGGDQVPFVKFWSGTMTSPSYQYGLELDGGTTPHIYFGTAGGRPGPPWAVPDAGAVEPPGGRVRRDARELLREREPGLQSADLHEHAEHHAAGLAPAHGSRRPTRTSSSGGRSTTSGSTTARRASSRSRTT